MVVRTLTTLTRLLDILSLLAPDRRIQVFFTYDDQNTAILGSDIDAYLRNLEAHVITWDAARRSSFALAIAASENDRLAELNAPVLLVPHGLGFLKHYPGTTVVAGMDPARLVQDERVVPAAIALSHRDQRDQLRRSCPQAAPLSVVVGDPCLDRLLAFRHHARRHRKVLDSAGKHVVVLASTWGPESLFGRMADLPGRLVSELPADEFTVLLVLHPGVHAAHSTWRLRGWLSEATRSGVVLVPPHGEWRSVLTAASCVISDSGSLALYAAALDKPILLTGTSATSVPNSPIVALHSLAPRVDPDRPLRGQLEVAMGDHIPGMYADIVDRSANYQTRSAHRLRPLLYRLMNLAEPTDEAAFPPIPGFRADNPPVAAFVAGVDSTADGLGLSRYPAMSVGEPELSYRHVAAHVDHATVTELDGATVLYLSSGDTAIEETLSQWPRAEIAAMPGPGPSCQVWTRDGTALELRVDAPSVDPLLLASLVQVRRDQGRPLANVERIRVGSRTIDVHVQPLVQVR
ncbi:hypothetical protein AOZ06_04405 [Kibdelosporangium phytohabitans]|uniref:Translation initiation factor 2 n=1 Tax=Kibdelosporangium phytohabitans TaxID=860235 RepID=A0A0N9HVX7_9PSEU|nr:hypothetical protein AOZ06_04405 [Kibdelosporangium phytohabitans]